MAPLQKQATALDQEYLRLNYHEVGFSYLLPDSLALFSGQARIYQQSLETYFRQGNFDAMAAEAHALKGAAGSVGAAALAELATGLEQSTSSRDIAQLIELMAELPQTVHQTVQAIAEELKLLSNSMHDDLDLL